MSLPFPVAFRPLTDDDVGFVVSSWLRSYHEGNRAIHHGVTQRHYKGVQRSVVQRAMDTGQVVIACDPETTKTIYGWASGYDDAGTGVVHYVYVLQTRRRYGLGRELVQQLGAAAKRSISSYSHCTETGKAFGRCLGLRHHPFALVRLLHADRQALRTGWNQDTAARTDPDLPRGERGADDGR